MSCMVKYKKMHEQNAADQDKQNAVSDQGLHGLPLTLQFDTPIYLLKILDKCDISS